MEAFPTPDWSLHPREAGAVPGAGEDTAPCYTNIVIVLSGELAVP